MYSLNRIHFPSERVQYPEVLRSQHYYETHHHLVCITEPERLKLTERETKKDFIN